MDRLETYNYDFSGSLGQFADRKRQPTTFEYDTLDLQTKSIYYPCNDHVSC
jgi:hypothetical protein